MKELTRIMNDFSLDLERKAPENIVSLLLRKAVKADRPVILKALVKLLVIEHARARLAEAELGNLKQGGVWREK